MKSSLETILFCAENIHKSRVHWVSCTITMISWNQTSDAIFLFEQIHVYGAIQQKTPHKV
jgi:hypothetical protein